MPSFSTRRWLRKSSSCERSRMFMIFVGRHAPLRTEEDAAGGGMAGGGQPREEGGRGRREEGGGWGRRRREQGRKSHTRLVGGTCCGPPRFDRVGSALWRLGPCAVLCAGWLIMVSHHSLSLLVLAFCAWAVATDASLGLARVCLTVSDAFPAPTAPCTLPFVPRPPAPTATRCTAPRRTTAVEAA